MGEAFIVGRGGSSSSSQGNLVTEIITSTQDLWVAPKCKNQQFHVRIFGGGGAGGVANYGADNIGGGNGGGSGYMNNGIFNISEGTIVSIQIGTGGRNGSDSSNGGTTSFGAYLSAEGGCGGDVNGYYASTGGAGGGIKLPHGYSPTDGYQGYRGTGYQFGGGAIAGIYGGSTGVCRGGKWGGGGGCIGVIDGSAESGSGILVGDFLNNAFTCGSCLYENASNSKQVTGRGDLGGHGVCTKGYNDDNWIQWLNSITRSNFFNCIDPPSNGTNTISNSELPDSLKGNGVTADYNQTYIYFGNYNIGSRMMYQPAFAISGGGGYGGYTSMTVGFYDDYSQIYRKNINIPCSGGGGYGSRGGYGVGGGGGYGGNGGNSSFYSSYNTRYIRIKPIGAGGGGGYGPGGDAEEYNYSSGYYTDSNGKYGGGGGTINGYNTSNGGQGGNGICIIQYYT